MFVALYVYLAVVANPCRVGWHAWQYQFNICWCYRCETGKGVPFRDDGWPHGR